ncbi:MAG: IS5 family transposase [Nitrospira sp.]|nr:IS5 family transposase [Nitrospira sp.]
MRGETPTSGKLFSYVSLEQRIPKDHPLRPIRRMMDEVLSNLSPRFDEMYSRTGRPSIPPEFLLRALLVQRLYSVRSERQLMEQLEYNLLFRWFVGLDMDAEVWDATTFTKNRMRMQESNLADEILAQVVEMAGQKGLTSSEHFTVDGTLLEACASQKSFRPKDEDDNEPKGSDGRDFHGEKRSNKTHASRTDPDARLYRKTNQGEAKLAYLGHAIIENRNGFVVAGCVTHADGHAERRAALSMLETLRGDRITLGADKAYDVKSFVEELREQGVTPHVAQNNKNRRSAIDRRTTRHDGYAKSQACRYKVERVPAWTKNIALLRKVKHRGKDLVGWL